MLSKWSLVVCCFSVLVVIGSCDECLEDNKYDYIIVGTGATGAVLINRLSEDANIRVLALEAGGEPSPVSEIPLLAFKAFRTEMDWNYTSQPQKHCCKAFDNDQFPIFRGHALGGTTSINFMTYTRGNKRDFDTWAALGNEGWSFDDLWPYFYKIEDYRAPCSRDDKPYHNQGGPLTVEVPSFKTPLADAFLQAGAETGRPWVDYNAKYQTGFMYPPVTTRDGARWNAYRAYLLPVMERENLRIETQALVSKILFDNHKRAIGVEYLKGSSTCLARAKREVIISGGAINTPQILMLSGIGPKDHLEALNITVTHDLPGVGENLQDHVLVGSNSYLVERPVTFNSLRYETDAYIDLWKKTRSGPMTVPVSFEGLAYLKTNVTDGPEDWPDLEIFFNTDNTIRIYKPYLKQVAQHFIPLEDAEIVTFLPILQRPKSRGSIRLNSSDPRDHPLIDPNYLSNPDDVNVLAEGIRIIGTLTETKAFKKFGMKETNFGILPTCDALLAFSKLEYNKCLVRTLTASAFHYTSSCKMGPATDPKAVVDNQLRVYGVKNLRVADASVMPTIVAAHPQAACVVIGEKLSDMIKNQLKNGTTV